MRSAAEKVVSKLVAAGHGAYFAGGAVRDLVMGKQPIDIDIATSATPQQVMATFQRTVPVGASFGVVVVLMDGFQFEVATFRSDGAYVDGRHPQSVRYATAEQDARRRDFTINGLFYDPYTDEVLDFVEGRKDIKAGLIRSIGDPVERFAEDRLRLLRAIRFSARFDYRIEAGTWRALVEAAPDILSVSWDRIRDELTKILTGARPRRAVELLEESGLLARVLPEVARLRGIPQPPEHHPEGDVLTHVLLVLDHMERAFGQTGQKVEPALAFAALLHDVGKVECTKVTEEGRITAHRHNAVGRDIAVEVCRRLRMPNALTDLISTLVHDHVKPMHAGQMRPASLKHLLRQDHFDELLELHRLDRLAGSGDLGTWELLSQRRREYAEKDLRPEPLLTGHDLIRLGYRPGPSFGRVLDALEDAQLEGRVTNRREAETLVYMLFTNR